MADITITDTSVAPGSGCVTTSGTAGATITAGAPVYVDTANSNVIKLADANASALTATVAGIAMHGASSGQPIAYATDGFVTYNAAFTASKAYILSNTAGAIAPIADHTTGWYMSLIGIAHTTTSLRLRIYNSGVTP
jgi:hypothetical protein